MLELPPPLAGPRFPEWADRGRVRSLLLTPLLALLALAGNVLHLPLFFGVDILFGSVAALLALVWLGTWPGILVALAGSLYTCFLWDHAYAVLILTAETAAVAWQLARAHRRGRERPPLAVAAALYWFLLGIPLVVLCYRLGLGLGWNATLLIAAKQVLNGILNAGLAGLVLLAAAVLARRPGVLPVSRVLFSVLLSALLLPAVLTTAWESRYLKARLEVEQAERLALLARFLVRDLGPRYHPFGLEGADLGVAVGDVVHFLGENLPPGSDPRVRLTVGLTGGPTGAGSGTGARERVIPTAAAGLDLLLPGERFSSRMAQWRAARYRLVVPADRVAPGQFLELEVSAAPLIERFQETLVRLLLILLAVAGAGVLLAQVLSRQFVRPLTTLVALTEALPAAIREARPWPAPRPGLLREPARLAEATAAMASTLAAGFRALREEKEAQARQRTLADLQARALGWLVAEPLDEAAFTERLCRHLQTLLPGHRCTLVQPGPGGVLAVLAAPGLTAAEVTGLDALLARPGGVCCYAQVMATGAPAAIADTDGDPRCADLPVPVRAEVRAGFALPVRGPGHEVLGVLALGSPVPGEVAAATREVLETAATLAGLALDSIRLRRRHEVLLERLRLSEMRLAESQHLADMGSWYMDLRTGEVGWSDQGYRLLGYAPQAVAPTLANFLRRIHPADRALVTEQLRAVRSGEPLPDEPDVRVVRPGGDERVVHYRTRAHRDPDGRVALVEGVSIDITARKEAEQALAAERQRLSNIIAATRVGTWEWEVQTGVAVVNERWAGIIGYRLADLAPISFQTWVDHTHPDDLAVSNARAEAHFRGETESYECEARMRHRDGHWVWVLDQGRVMERDAAGRPLLMSGIHQDITARKVAELALAERESMLGELLALAAEFVAVSDHGLDALTERALARIGGFARAGRSYLFRLDETAGTLNNTLEWVAPGVRPAIDLNLAIPVSDLPELMLRLRLGEPVAITRVAELPADWSREREIFIAQEIESLMVAPLVVGDELLGCVGFDAVGAARDWSAVQVRFLQVFANILAGTIDRARATADLRASNARYEELARQSRSMSWEIDPAGRYTYLSPVCEQVLGYRAAELLGRHLADLAPAADQASIREGLRTVMERRAPLRDLDRAALGVDGWRVWLMTSGAPFCAADGSYLGYRGIDTDITDRHLAQDLLRESEARLSAVFENAPIGMALVGSDQRLTLVNRALAAFLGRAPADLVGLPFETMLHPDETDTGPGSCAVLHAGPLDSYRVTRHYRRPDGRVVWGDLRVSLLPTRPGAAPLPLVMVEDVTELHAATERQLTLESALTRYANQLEDLVDLINRPLAPIDKDRALLRLGCRTLGVEAAVLGLVVDGREQQVLVAVPDDGALAPDLLTAILTDTLAHRGSPVVLDAERLPGAGLGGTPGACIGLAFDGPHPDGQVETLCLSLWGSGSSLELGDAERQMIRLVAQRLAAVRYQEQIHRDLVESRERETIGHLASGVAHDFNNLLGVIDANIYFLGLGLPGAATDPELRQVLDETQSALGQAKVITSGMLSLSRAGGVPLERVDLAAAVGELERILRQVLPPGIRLRVTIPADLRAWTNAGFLQAALLNLALNARDAMPRGGTLTIAAAPAVWTGTAVLAVGGLAPGDCVELRVSDTGSGIDPGIIGHIFDPLFSTKAKQRGHGLGLFMVQEFVVRSGAGLGVESRVGQGTRFRLLLPPASAVTPVAAPRPDPGAVPPGRLAGVLAGLKVLVVDDDPRVREAVGRLLTLEGARLVQAEHGRAALAVLDRDPGVELVLSDVAMPELDGVGLYRCLLRDRPGLPVVLMTGQNEAPAALADLPERPLVLRKPLDPPALRAAVAACVRR